MAIVEWDRRRLDELVALAGASLPEEHLGADDVLACTFEDDGAVLACEDGGGAVAVVRREVGGAVLASVQLVVVHPEARRAGRGRQLLAAAVGWADGVGAVAVGLGGGAPWYLWPGVDVRSTPALCLAEAAGFRARGAEVNMALPTTFRASERPELEVLRALDGDVAARAMELVGAHWPHWRAEVARGVDNGTCLVARDGLGDVLGVACHSVNRPGWLGPMATRPDRHGTGVGSALVGAACRDLMVAGHDHVEIAWVGPVRFYAKLGARVSRVFRTYVRTLG